MTDWGSLKEFLTIGAAVLGAGLGIMNTWQAMSQRWLRLRIRPCHAIAVPHGDDGFSIEIINLSTFSVTINEVGFTDDSQSIKCTGRFAITAPMLIDGKPWPRRLNSREAVSVFFTPPSYLRGRKIGKAYARTACGDVRYGDSPALQQLREALVA